jgi:Big-like domain-containing protein/exo-rhamnogalacturonan lyase-like protein
MKIAVCFRRELTRSLVINAWLVLVLILSAFSAFAQLNVPLTIQEMTYPGQAGIARTSEPLTVGIPLAKGVVPCANANPASCAGVSTLGLTGATLGQFRCLVEWDDQSCKWVLVDTQATVAAGGVNTSISLNNAGTGNFGGTNLATDGVSTISVDTGAAQFVIKKANFNGLDSVVVGGATLVATGTSSGLVVVGPAPGATSCGTCTTTYTSSNDAASTAVIEENGPVRTVIKADGAHKDAAGNTYMRWTVRLYFYKGKSYVKANVSLRNADNASTALNTAYKGFASYELRLTPALGAGRSYAFGNDTATPTSAPFTGSETAYLYQAYTSHMEHSDWGSSTASFITRSGATYAQNGYQINQGAATVLRGAASTAASKMFGDIADSTGAGVLAGVYLGGEFWPKSVQFQNGGSEIRVGIWPDQTLYTGTCSLTPCASPYYQAWPQHSIHDVYLNFHNTALASPQNEFLKQQFSLVGRAAVDYYNTTNAMFNSLINPSEEDAYYRAQAMSCCIADFTPNVFRYYAWPNTGGSNQADFALAYMRNFLERGYTGRYLWALNRYRFDAEQAFPRSDGFNWRTSGSSLDSWGFPTAGSTNSGNANRAWVDQEHAHWYGMVDYYYVSGDETIHDAINDGPKDRFLNTTASLNTGNLWNERAIGNELIAIARMYLLAKGTNDADAPGFLTVADKVLAAQVFPDIPNPAAPGTPAQGQQGTSMSRGIHYGCCGWDSFANPPATNGPGGAGTARQDKPFMTSIMIQGVYELAQARGASWTSTTGTDQYNHAIDYAYGMAHWALTEGYVDNGVCSPVSTCGSVYEVFLDYPQTLSAQNGQETIWYPYYVEQLYKGDVGTWQRKLNIQLKQVDQANSGGSWDENANYAVNQAIFSALHPGTVTQQDVPVTVVNNGAGSYTISWTAPAGVTKYRLKHFNGKQIVDDLGWNVATNTSTFAQASFNPFWSAPATRQQPTTAQSSITVTLDDITGAALAATGENFALKAWTTSGAPADTAPPTVAMSAPANAATVSGTVAVSATASDNVGVVGVQFLLDGANLGAEDTATPYTVSWNSTTAANGSHTLSARARDAAGNTTTASVTVTVSNADATPPTVSITAPANGSTVLGTLTVSATAADNVGVVGVQFQLDGVNLGAEDTTSPYSTSWNTATATNASHTLSAIARDAAGNKTTATVSVTVNNPVPDTTPPTASITSPAAAATVAGTISITATASDNVGVVGVQFQLDGTNLGAEDTASPYSASWNTTTATNGAHTLSAIARDAAGNKTTATVSVTVSNIAPTTAMGVGVDASTQFKVELRELAPLVTCPTCWFATAADTMAGQTLEIRVRPATNPAIADQVILKQGAVDGTVASVGTNSFVIVPTAGTVWPASITVTTGSGVTTFNGFASATGPVTAGQKVSVRGLLFKSTPSGVQLVASNVLLRP